MNERNEKKRKRMISGHDFIALITLILFVYAQTPYWNGNAYRAIPMWLEYIGSSFRMGTSKQKAVIVEPSWKLVGQLIFSVMWFIIYAFLVATGYLIYAQPSSVQNYGAIQAFYGLFIANIILNKFWTPVFFGEYKYFSFATGTTVTTDTFVTSDGKTIKEKPASFIVKKYNCPTIGRVSLAGVIAVLIFATAAAMLGVLASLVADNVITDDATRVVPLLGLSIYTLWSLAAIIMNSVIGCCVVSKDNELSKLMPL